MQLAKFVEGAAEEILQEAVAFARTLDPLKDLPEVELRNHIPKLLQAITADLGSVQSRRESIAKSRGEAAAPAHETAAQTHGLQRAHRGLTIAQVVAEYRALRSSVLRLWGEAHPPDKDAIRDIGRFNEAIDQAVAESVQFYAAEKERWQQIFLGILGHDLRTRSAQSR